MSDPIELAETDTLVQLIRERLRYEPEAGKLYWRDHASLRPCSRARIVGKEAFTHINHNGYRDGVLLGKHLLAHRAVWVIVNGRFPEIEIDHVNGDKLDNRIANLREATKSQNGMNRPVRSDNLSGLKGVSFHRGRRKWFSRIRLEGRQKHLGYYDTPEAAHAAYCDAALSLHGEFARVA